MARKWLETRHIRSIAARHSSVMFSAVVICMGDAAARYRRGAETEKRGRRMNKRNIGSSFDGWLREEGMYEQVTATAVKRVLARQVEAAMKEKTFPRRRWRGGCAPAVRRWIVCLIPSMMQLR
jgi:hypothetical protein